MVILQVAPSALTISNFFVFYPSNEITESLFIFKEFNSEADVQANLAVNLRGEDLLLHVWDSEKLTVMYFLEHNRFVLFFAQTLRLKQIVSGSNSDLYGGGNYICVLVVDRKLML